MRTAAATILAAAMTVAAAVPAAADHALGHEPPQGPAAVRFAADVPVLHDDEWGFPIGGFGGIAQGHPLRHAPVVFVHGNNVDHADWYPVRDDFQAAGWSNQELWGLSYNGLGNDAGASPRRGNPEADEERREMGGDGASRVTANDINVADLARFIRTVRTYTGSPDYHLVTHSLGVTLARQTLRTHPDLAADLVSFVGIAGANHGTSLCPPGTEGRVHSCDEIAAGTTWLNDLNGPDGELETYGSIRWMTVYDGTGAGDVAFAGPAYAQSPTLRGADNRAYPGVDHNGLRLDPTIVTDYRVFVEAAERDRLAAGTGEPPGADAAAGATPGRVRDRDPVADLPATGAGLPQPVAAVLLLLSLLTMTAARRSAARPPTKRYEHV
jgi:pimeloyl-ACP methyl ester carboxylesterase